MSFDFAHILPITAALALVWVTIFLCVLLYQAARVLRNANNIIENLTHKLELIVEAVEFIKERVDGMTSRMGVLSGVATKLVDSFVMGPIKSKLNAKISAKMKAPPPKRKKSTAKTKKKK
ncbi:MAG: hypothetical protein HN726_04380 [Candidatus Magasanikbacteria bacterium]|jgi:hypothetical protein|nr:hypothetical protein [Candidatus Magasanikbacteria bacterium]MBT4220827.1 hypothetical protein [Candidatus Magasanikbacteria bacterium]MBT4350172.1 hypothetical protein [Candidatus Magasanikbacteria bacterium]MBT4541385.1 hypothetical protein [Candidatus Magasanikbacteria bacterium]MBT6253175.1 hypothetical protein [Candidatus Magasanikbacteria bacterium]